MWQALAAPRCNKARHKLSTRLLEALNAEQNKILKNPYKGDRKKGALKNVWVEKFQAENDQFLIAYEIDGKRKQVIFLDIGQHENFYRDLQRYLR